MNTLWTGSPVTSVRGDALRVGMVLNSGAGLWRITGFASGRLETQRYRGSTRRHFGYFPDSHYDVVTSTI